MRIRLSTRARPLVLSIGALVCVACATVTAAREPDVHVDDASLAGLSARDRAPVVRQERIVAQARHELADARVTKQQADRSLWLSQGGRGEAALRLREARKEADLAQSRLDEYRQTGTNLLRIQPMFTDADIQAQKERVITALVAVTEMHHRLDEASAKREYLRSVDDVAGKTLARDQQAIRLEDAKLNRTKFAALERVRPARARQLGLHLQDFDAVIGQREKDLADANTMLARATARIGAKQKAWIAALDKLRRPVRRPSEAAAIPPPPLG
jgi:hypothetical protein